VRRGLLRCFIGCFLPPAVRLAGCADLQSVLQVKKQIKKTSILARTQQTAAKKKKSAKKKSRRALALAVTNLATATQGYRISRTLAVFFCCCLFLVVSETLLCSIKTVFDALCCLYTVFEVVLHYLELSWSALRVSSGPRRRRRRRRLRRRRRSKTNSPNPNAIQMNSRRENRDLV